MAANVTAGILFVMLLVSNTQSVILSNQQISQESTLLTRLRGGSEVEKATAAPDRLNQPDIYYIILDSYEGAGGLQKYYHFDNSAFLQALKARGFYVASDSHSNYLNTSFSVSSSLNLVYLDQMPSSLLYQMTNSLQKDFARDFLRLQGYQMATFDAGYGFLDNNLADIHVHVHSDPQPIEVKSSRNSAINNFELALFQTTAGGLALQSGAVYLETPAEEIENSSFESDFNNRRERIMNAFDHLDNFTRSEGSFFIYAHILSPHNPYLWDADGNELNYPGHEYLLGVKADPELNIRLYTDQLQYVNQMALDVIDRILSESSNPPVIILQGDHGHDTFFDWPNPTEEGVDLRSTILNAYYFPDGDYNALYPTITPVNSFRVVFNKFFGSNFPILEDHTYYHNATLHIGVGSPVEFIEFEPGKFPSSN